MEQMRLVVRSIFSFILLYLLSFVVGVGVFCLSAWLLYDHKVIAKYDLPNIAFVVLLCGSAFLLFQMIRSLCQSYKTDTRSMSELSPQEMPKLFEMIDEVARFMKTEPPRKVYLSSSVTASVFLSTPSTLFFSPRKKRLEIGVGLINILTMEELKAVIAHEMGHFSQRSMFLGGYVYSIEQAVYFISRHVDYKKRGLWEQQVKGLFSIFHVFAQLIFRKLNRRFKDFSLELEYDADRLAVECVGAPILRSALLKTSFASMIFQETITILGNWAIHGKRVSDIYTAHRYTMDAYLSAFGNGKRFTEKLWRKSPVQPPTIISCRLGRLVGGNTNQSLDGQPSREYISMLQPFCNAFTKHIYQNIYHKDFERLEECRLFTYRKWIGDYYLWFSGQRGDVSENMLHIILPAKLHRLPLVNAMLDVHIDKQQIGEGSFKKGIALAVPIATGEHTLSITCWSECYMNKKIVVKEDKNQTINLDYSVELSKGRYNFFVRE